MSVNHIPVQFSDRRRRAIDRYTRRLVTCCGGAILLLMMLLFFWLLWVVLPLFSAPGVHSLSHQRLWDASPALAIGNKGSVGWRISRDGKARFIPLNGQPPEPALMLTPAPQQVVTSADGNTVLLNAQGSLTLLQPVISKGEGEWHFPLGDSGFRLPQGDVKEMAVATLRPDQWRIAALTDAGVSLLTLETNRQAALIQLPGLQPAHLVLSPKGDLLYTTEGRLLRVWQIDDGRAWLRETQMLPAAPQYMQLLAGGQTLLIQDSHGITQWFSIAGDNGLRLHAIRTFAHSAGQGLIVSEAQRRVFATFDQTGLLKVFASKQDGPILQHQLAPGILQAKFSPQGDSLLLERSSGWETLKLTNPWPDVTWRNFWQKIWYENYPKADWVWQSTNAGDSYQAKFSLIPMVVGTLKAASMALLFATPLALAAAMYTAWFMAPGLRRWVKPAIEMMGALPSVVIGLIAGLWLAPHVGQALTGILLLPVTLAGSLLGCGILARRLPARWRQPGHEVILLLPVLLIVAALTLWLPTLIVPDAGDWLPHYAQRNLLIAALAMGFALVPMIFTLAEDALFSVPASLGQGSLALGATPWQTLTRVVLPGASAGIFAALMIGFGRAVGETMILLMATGNTPQTEGGLFSGLRTLSANIAIEMPEAAVGSAHYRILFLSALVLLVFTLMINTVAELIRQRLRLRFSQYKEQA